jgi:hypothetical protein
MGTLTFQATAGGSVNLLGPNISGTVNLTLPSADGTSGQPLQTNGSGTLSFANLAIANGGTGATSFTANQIHYGSFSQSANLTFNGTTLTANTLNLTNALGTAYGGTGLTSFTANGVVYASSTSALATGSAFVFDGTNVGIGTSSPSQRLTINDTGSGLNRDFAVRNGDATNYHQLAVGYNAGVLSTGVPANSLFLLAEKGGGYGTVGGLSMGTIGAAPIVFINNGAETARFDSTGNLGIGTNAPARALTISISAASDNVILAKSGAANSYIGFADSGTTDQTGLSVRIGSSGNGLLFQTGGTTTRQAISSAGIVTMSAYGVGTATFSAAGVISSVSDETWKIKDGMPVDPNSMLKKLEPGYWYYNNEKKEIFGVDRQLGFYAQNVNAALGPEAAPTPEEGKPWGYYDRSVLAITVMSLQKVLATIESLTARIEALEAK